MKTGKMVQKQFGWILIIFFLFGCNPQPSLPRTETSQATQSSVEPTITVAPTQASSGTFEVNNHSLYIECLGAGSPTIVLEPGEGGTHVDMQELQKRLSVLTTTCTYDRVHTGKLRTAEDVVDDLQALLQTAKVPGPFVLIGSSAGGLFVQLYARKYPDQVVGIVAMNPVPPAHPWLDKVNQIFTPQQYADEETYFGGNNGESFDYLTSSEQLKEAGEPPAIPFEMLLSTDVQCEGDEICLKSYPTYEQILQEVTSTWPRGKFSQVAAGHEIYSSNIGAVVTVVKQVLTSQ